MTQVRTDCLVWAITFHSNVTLKIWYSRLNINAPEKFIKSIISNLKKWLIVNVAMQLIIWEMILAKFRVNHLVNRFGLLKHTRPVVVSLQAWDAYGVPFDSQKGPIWNWLRSTSDDKVQSNSKSTKNTY